MKFLGFDYTLSVIVYFFPGVYPTPKGCVQFFRSTKDHPRMEHKYSNPSPEKRPHVKVQKTQRTHLKKSFAGFAALREVYGINGRPFGCQDFCPKRGDETHALGDRSRMCEVLSETQKSNLTEQMFYVILIT